MVDVLVVAGTADAREIIAGLIRSRLKVAATVTTSFGNSLLQSAGGLAAAPDGLEIYEGGLDAAGMAELLQKTQAACLVDASHPFAQAASLNAGQACRQLGIPYLRFERAATPLQGLHVIRVSDFVTAAARVQAMPGNILLAIGSHQLAVFTRAIPDYKTRLFVRVLPAGDVLAACEQLGLSAQNILALKGPFSEEMNMAMLNYCQARVLVTKESGETGGTLAKIRAANRLGIPVLLIERPQLAYGVCIDRIPELMSRVHDCLKLRVQSEHVQSERGTG